MTLADPRTALEELMTAVTALKLPLGIPWQGANAFDKVNIFDLQELTKAMEELFLYHNRIALIGLDSIDHENVVAGRTLRVMRSLSVTIIVADRRFSDRQKAMMGDGTTPGALYLEKLLVDGVAGELPSGAVMLPGTGRLIALENDKRKDETGRIIFAQDFDVALDWQAVSLSRIAKVSPA